MPYERGSRIEASDYNYFIGDEGTSVYSNIIDAQQKVGALYGIGYGDRGYGQTSTSLSALSSGTIISAMPWSNLRDIMIILGSHQGTDLSSLPTIDPVFTVEAYTNEYTDFDYFEIITDLDINRFDVDALNMTLTPLDPYVSTNSWSDIMSFTLDISWPTEDEARYFFNSGGEIRISIEHPDTSSSQNTDWGTLLSDIDTISLSSHGTGKSGIGFIASTIGYYELTDTDQLIYTTASGLIPSSGEKDVYIKAKRLNYTGDNGANGTGIRITIQLEDGVQPVSPDSVEPGTEITFSHYRSTAIVTGITSPTFTSPTFAYTGVPITPEEPDDPTDPSVPEDPPTLGLQPFWSDGSRKGGFTTSVGQWGPEWSNFPKWHRSTIARSTGKFYVEFLVEAKSTWRYCWGVGLIDADYTYNPSTDVQTLFMNNSTYFKGMILTNKIISGPLSGLGTSVSIPDSYYKSWTIMLACDFDNNKIWVGSQYVQDLDPGFGFTPGPILPIWANSGNPDTGFNPTYTLSGGYIRPYYLVHGLINHGLPPDPDFDSYPDNDYDPASIGNQTASEGFKVELKLLSDYRFSTPSGFTKGW